MSCALIQVVNQSTQDVAEGGVINPGSIVRSVTVQIYENGNPIPGAIASGYAAAAETPVTLPIVATLRKACACGGMSSITFMLTEGAGSVTNVSVRGEKA